MEPHNDRRIAYSNADCFDMMMIYGECRQNSRIAAMEYALRYPNRRHPSNGYIHRLAGKLQRTGNFHGKEPGARLRPGRQTPPELIEVVRESVTRTPHTSTRKIARHQQITQKVAHVILKKHLGWRPWKRHTTQRLFPRDFEQRRDFCEDIIERVSKNASVPTI